MRVISTFYQPSSVCCSVKCSLTPGNYHLVVGKPNRLEVYSLTLEGMHFEFGVEIWGVIVTVKSVYVQASQAHKILLLTDHPHPKLLLFSYSVSEAGAPSLKEDFVVDLEEPGAQPSEFLTDVIVDPSGSALVTACYARKFKVVLLINGIPSDHFDVSVPEHGILSIAFLPTPSDNLTLGILHINNEQHLQLTSRNLDLTAHELSPPPKLYFPSFVLSSTSFPVKDNSPVLIPVYRQDPTAHPVRGLIVLGYKEISFFEAEDSQKVKHIGVIDRASRETSSSASKQRKLDRGSKQRATIAWPWDEISAWCQVDEFKYLLGDTTGRLALLELRINGGFTLLPLGEANCAVSLTYLSSQIVYLGSFSDGSQLLKIHPAPFTKLDTPTLPLSTDLETISTSEFDAYVHTQKHNISGKVIQSSGCYIEVLQEFSNLAPICDAVLFETNNGGQQHIVTCSGGGVAGSLQLVSSGASFFEHALIPIADVTSLFSIRASYFTSFHTYMVVSTPSETFMFRVEPNSLTHIDPLMITGLATAVPTIAMSNVSKRISRTSTSKQASSYVDSSFVVQVTPREVLLLDFNQALGMPILLEKPWSPNYVEAWRETQIVAADINASQILLALSGGVLVWLRLDEHNQFHLRAYKDFDCEISVVSCSPLNPSQFYSTTVVVGFWESNSVHILSLSDPQSPFKSVCTSGSLPALPRSVLLHNFGSSCNNNHFDYKPHLLIGLSDGSLISYVYDEVGGALRAKKTASLGSTTVHLTAYNVNDTRSVFACGSRAEVLYWDKQRLRHSPVPLTDATWATHLCTATIPSSLAVCTRDKIVIGWLRNFSQVHIRSISSGAGIPQRILFISEHKAFAVAYSDVKSAGKLRLLDQLSFKCLAEYVCEAGEEISALEHISMPNATYICVGTVYVLDPELEPSKGRLIFLKISANNDLEIRLSQVLEIAIQGCVHALAIVGEALAVAANSSVIIFKLSELHGLQVERSTSWNQSYVVTSLVSDGNLLFVGDIIHSISVLELNDGVLTIKSRDHTPLCPFKIQSIGNNDIVGGNVNRTLFTFRSQQTDDKTTLECDGSYNLHELITKLIPGTLSRYFSHDDEEPVLTPKLTFFTSTGRIGIISDLNQALALKMTALQSNMEKVVRGPGNMKHDMLRASNSRYETHSSFGFLDGQFLEQFVNLGPDIRRRILEGSNEAEKLQLTEAQIEHILERFQLVH